MNVAIVIPTYNERENIKQLLDRINDVIQRSEHNINVLFVDDSSPDGTSLIIESLSSTYRFVSLLKRGKKMGLGSAYIDGFRFVIDKMNPDIIVEMDADLQHPPEKIPELINMVAYGYHVVIASRRVSGGGEVGFGLFRRIVSRSANYLSRIILGLRVRDSTSGFRAYSAYAARELVRLKLPAEGYSFQVASIYLLQRKGIKMIEIPFTFYAREKGRSKLTFNEIINFIKMLLSIKSIQL